MIYSKLLLLLSVILLITVNCVAVLPDSLSNKGYYEQLRYQDQTGKTSVLYNANIREDFITGFVTSTDSITVNFDQISKLEYKTGSKGEKITLVTTCIGLAFGLGLSFAMMASDNREPEYDTDDEDNTDVYMLPIYVCAGAGFLIGLPFMGICPIYKTLYDEKKQTGLNLHNLKLNFALGDLSGKNNKYLGFSYRF